MVNADMTKSVGMVGAIDQPTTLRECKAPNGRFTKLHRPANVADR